MLPKRSKVKSPKPQKEQIVLGPKSLKQEMFLNTEADICVFGGGAGSGKSFLGLMDMLKHVNDPKYRGVVIRRLTPQIHGPGGVFETAVSMYRQVFEDKLKIRKRDGVLVFPSGAEVCFRHMQYEDDKYSLQGWQISSALIDEAQQMEESQCVYAMSRLRTDAKMKPYMRMTCNPDKNSFLRRWIDWYLLPNSGLPDPAKCGVLRYFVMQDNTMMWGDSKEELISKFGPTVRPLSFTFIGANVYDNPVLCERSPDYPAWLEGLPRVERARLLLGDWDSTEMASGFWKREWVSFVDQPPSQRKARVRAYDLAAGVESEVSSPDYSVGILMSQGVDKNYYVEHMLRFRDRFAGVEQRIFAQAEADGRSTTIVLPIDPGAAGKMYAHDLGRRLSEKGYTVRFKRPDRSKVVRFGPFATISEVGLVRIVNADWNQDFLEELEAFNGNGKGHDDIVDATADAFWAVKTSSLELPNFSLPDLSKTNEFMSLRLN